MPDFGRWTSSGGDPSLNEINRTDRFLDSLANQQPVYATDPGEAELAHLLAGWRDDIRDAPLTAALTPRDAVLALDRAAVSRRRTRASLAVVGSVAAAVLCLGGLGAVVAGAGPGDALYGLRTMLFGEQQNTRDDAVVLAAQTQLAEVQKLIDQGQWEAAQDKLQTLTTTVASVNDTERKDQLVSRWQELTVKVAAQDPAATVPPGAPLPTFPEVPAVVLETPPSGSETTSSDTSTSTSGSQTTSTSPSTTSPSETSTSAPSGTPTSAQPTTTSAPAQQPSPSAPPTPQPTPSPSQAPRASAALPTPSAPLPTPSAAATPLPTPASQVPLPTSTVVQQEEEQPTQEAPVLEAPAPKSVVTTTVPMPVPGDEPR